MEDPTVTAYRLNEAHFNARVATFRSAPDLASLRNEIALCRATLEERLANASTPQERATLAPTIRDFATTIAALTKIHQQREIQANELLHKDALLQLMDRVVKIIVDELSTIDGHEDIVDRITSRLIDELADAKNTKSNKDE